MKRLWISIAIISVIVLFTVNRSHAFFQDEKSTVRLYLEYYKYSPVDRVLGIKVLTRKDRRYSPVEGVKIEFYLAKKSKSGYLGSLVTDSDGQGFLVLPSQFYVTSDTLLSYLFIASLSDNAEYKNAEKELEIIDANIEVHGIEQDTQKFVQAVVRVRDSTLALAVMPDVVLFFLVERPLCLLPIAELITTDDKGMAMVPFPTDLPGDSEGYITVVVKIDDSDLYGTVENRETIRWGVPIAIDDKTHQRSLWAARANAPIPLILVVNGLILAAWGAIIYISSELYRIRKI